MASIRRNVLANYAGSLWSALLGLAFPPIFLRMLGAESYGLIGFFSSLAAVLGVLDLGLATTLQRRLALLSADRTPASAQRMHDATRTFGAFFWSTGAVAGLVICLLAPLIARRWVHVDRLPISTAVAAIRMMGLVLALQWPGTLYSNALLGLQRQVEYNVLNVVLSTLRSAGAALVLWKVSRTVGGFFGTQLLIMALTTASTVWLLRRALPRAGAPRFHMEELREGWRFSAGLWGIAILSVALTQIDKVTVGKLLPLADLGYYTLASSAGMAVLMLVGPVFSALFPRFCQLVASGDEVSLRALYHRGCQAMSVIILPAASVLTICSRDAMMAWTGNPIVVARTSAAVTALTIGSACNGLVNLSYALQLAHGWTRLAFWTNVLAAILLLPLVWLLGTRYGLPGVAMGWTVVNVGYVVIMVPLMHRRLLRGGARRWATRDVGLPLLGAVVPVLTIRLLAPVVGGRLQSLAVVGVSFVLASVGCTLAAGDTRKYLLGMMRGRLRASPMST
jgi:O-antigen/teichoic acid export membrane protein